MDAFAGPGGWEQGARILGGLGDILGVEVDAQACATATAAGHTRHQADIRDLDPTDFPAVTGFICSSPCPTFSAAGTRSGLKDEAYQAVLDAVTCAGSACDCTWQEVERDLRDSGVDERTALAAQTIRFALQLPTLEWLAVEQVPAAEYLFEDIAAELMSFDDGTGEGGHGPGWESADVLTLEASDLGMPVSRKRTFLVARRTEPLGQSSNPIGIAGAGGLPPAPTLAQALGWEHGHSVRTRGNRRATGGNCFSADGPSWCLTEKARTWERDDDGARLTPEEAGLLQGFPRDYPWQGSRTRQFHQAGDVVLPPVAAAVLGYVTGIEWVEPVRQYLQELYGTDTDTATPTAAPADPAAPLAVSEQLSLFSEAA